MNMDTGLDPMLAGATGALYAIENSGIVKEHFDELYTKLVESFDDQAFLEKLKSLKGRGKTTVSITLPEKNAVLCFVNKLWFSVQKSSSTYWDAYYVGIGVNMKRSKFNPMSFSKIWIARAACGEIDQIKEKINAPDFKDSICEKLANHVYDSVEKNMYEMLTD